MAKTEVVAGTSQATHYTVVRGGAEKAVRAYSEVQQQVEGQQVAYAPPPQAASAPASPTSEVDTISQLERLGALKDQRVLIREEFHITSRDSRLTVLLSLVMQILAFEPYDNAR